MGFTNPVYGNNFADPQVVAVDNVYYAFATNGPLGNVQTLTSPDLVSWEPVGDALPALAPWTAPGRVWAPEVAVHAADRYVMYYTSADTASGRQAIGVAVASRPEGPYVDKSPSPLINQVDEGGSIDASPFQDSTGKRWLYWKNDGNAIGVDTWIYASELSADGLTLVGPTHRLIKQTLPWEGNLVEAPYMVERNGKFHLFYSANAFDKAEYAVGHALCTHSHRPLHQVRRPHPAHLPRRRRPRPQHGPPRRRPRLVRLPRLEPNRPRHRPHRPHHVALRTHLDRRHPRRTTTTPQQPNPPVNNPRDRLPKPGLTEEGNGSSKAMACADGIRYDLRVI